MFDWKHNGRTTLLTAASVLLCTLGLSACGSQSNGVNTTTATPQGTIDLTSLKVGLPEEVFQKAVITFVPDPKGATDGKIQYLSRTADPNGGQYIAQCKDGRCYELQVMYNSGAVSHDTALKTLQQMIPPEAGTETKVDDAEVKAGKAANPLETHDYGNDYKGQIAYGDKKATGVILVNAWYLPASIGSNKQTQ